MVIDNILFDFNDFINEFFLLSYDENGKILEPATIKVRTFKKLLWDLNNLELQHSVENAHEDTIKIINVRFN